MGAVAVAVTAVTAGIAAKTAGADVRFAIDPFPLVAAESIIKSFVRNSFRWGQFKLRFTIEPPPFILTVVTEAFWIEYPLPFFVAEIEPFSFLLPRALGEIIPLIEPLLLRVFADLEDGRSILVVSEQMILSTFIFEASVLYSAFRNTYLYTFMVRRIFAPNNLFPLLRFAFICSFFLDFHFRQIRKKRKLKLKRILRGKTKIESDNSVNHNRLNKNVR